MGKGEVTIFEPSLKRVEVEDLKGLQVTLVITAMAIADVYFGGMRTGFWGDYDYQGASDRYANLGLVVPRSAALAINRAWIGSGSGGGSSAAPPPPCAGSPPPGFTTKARLTKEQLFNPAYQQ